MYLFLKDGRSWHGVGEAKLQSQLRRQQIMCKFYKENSSTSTLFKHMVINTKRISEKLPLE